MKEWTRSSFFNNACHGKKLRFGSEKRDCLVFENSSLLWHMKKLRSESICHDPKKFEIKYQQASTSREQSFGSILRVWNGLQVEISVLENRQIWLCFSLLRVKKCCNNMIHGFKCVLFIRLDVKHGLTSRYLRHSCNYYAFSGCKSLTPLCHSLLLGCWRTHYTLHNFNVRIACMLHDF